MNGHGSVLKVMECGSLKKALEGMEMRRKREEKRQRKRQGGWKRVVRGQHSSDQRSRLVEVLLRKDRPPKGNISTK